MTGHETTRQTGPFASLSTSAVLVALVGIWNVLTLGGNVLFVAGVVGLPGLVAMVAAAHLLTALGGAWALRADAPDGLSTGTYVILAVFPLYAIAAHLFRDLFE